MNKLKFLLCLFTAFCSSGLFAQNNYELTSKDSSTLLNYWEDLRPVMLSKTNVLPYFISDSIMCYMCVPYVEDSFYLNPIVPFVAKEQLLKVGVLEILEDSYMKRSLKIDTPNVGIIVYENENFSDHQRWVMSFNFLKPHELAAGHEGASLNFEFDKVKGVLMLVSINTIP